MHTRCFHLLACLFFCSNNFAQQYPFVYYTPKDGLVNSRVQGIKQDSKGRMYFTTYGGLSVYDGTRFVNYTQNNGLANELVNDIAELGPDSFLVATNTPVLNTLIKGKVAVFKTANNFCPLINRFLKSSDSKWYVAADDGLFVLEENRFRRLNLIDRNGNDLGLHLEGIIEWKNFFLIIPWRMDRTRLLLYDRQKNKLLNVYQNESLFNAATDLQGRIWLSGTDGIKLIDTILLQQKGQIDFLPLPMKYKHVFDKKDGSIFFDTQGDTWLYGGNHVLKFSPDFDEQSFSSEQGLKASRLAGIFRDREGIVWIATDGNGVIKLNGVHVQLLSNFSVNRPGMISAMQQQNDTLWMFNVDNNTVYSLRNNQLQAYPLSGKKMNASNLLVRDDKLYLGDGDKIICIRNKNDIHSYKYPQTELTADSIVKSFGTSIADAQGAIIQLYRKNGSTNYLCVLKEGKLYLMDYPISYATDQMTFDQQGRLWMVTRDNHLLVFTIHPQQPEKYIQLLKEYFKELPKMNARSIAVDKNNNVWIGTRYNGLYRLEFNGVRLKSYKQFTTRNGLTDNFIYNLHCDNNNTVWIGTQSGLDKIFWKDGRYLIGNVSKTYNFFQSVLKIITTKDNTVWSLTNEGNILKISPTNISTTVPAPSLFLSSLHVNNREHHNFGNSFSYLENNLSFHVAAPSFTDEKSIRYSYRLEGSSNSVWSEPSNNASFNVMNLAPGEYSLHVRSDFPEALYSPQTLVYSFTIKPPFWQTWWFSIGIGFLAVGILGAGIRAYYRRKLEKRVVLLEKIQAVEKERTRIATDMHDDLGAGLTGIKFLSENIMEHNISADANVRLEKLKGSANKLIESMGEIIWAMNEKNNTLEDLLFHLRRYSYTYCEENGLTCDFNLPENIEAQIISGYTRRTIFLIVKECLHNIVKHANAKKVEIKIDIKKDLVFEIQDDGKGFHPGEPEGNGLINMQKRAKEMNGSFSIFNKHGTFVLLKIPISV